MLTGNVAVAFPSVTVTLCGTSATAGMSLARATTAPLGGANPVSVTVPLKGPPPAMGAGLTVSEASVMGLGAVANGAGANTISAAIVVTPILAQETTTRVETD